MILLHRKDHGADVILGLGVYEKRTCQESTAGAYGKDGTRHGHVELTNE